MLLDQALDLEEGGEKLELVILGRDGIGEALAVIERLEEGLEPVVNHFHHAVRCSCMLCGRSFPGYVGVPGGEIWRRSSGKGGLAGLAKIIDFASPRRESQHSAGGDGLGRR